VGSTSASGTRKPSACNRLERVCRYLLRPPFAHDAVERTADGQVRVHFKAPSKSGATYTQMSPHTFLAKLCALVPPPSFNMTRYFGLLANRHALRPRIVPDDHAHDDEPKQLALFLPRNDHELAAITKPLRDEQLRERPPTRLSWMQLLARVFQIDVSVCSRCGGPMRIVRAVSYQFPTCTDQARCDRGRAARRTCTTAAVAARTVEVVHAELSRQLVSSSRDDVLGSACHRFAPKHSVDRRAPSHSPQTPPGKHPELRYRPRATRDACGSRVPSPQSPPRNFRPLALRR
jgi:hypothetical protein